MKVSDLTARYRAPERTVRILLDGTLDAELERARWALKQAQREEARNPQGLRTVVPDLERRIADLERQADEAAAEIVLRAVPGVTYDALQLKHPPSEEQWETYREQAKATPLFAQPPQVNPDTLAPDLLALSIVSIDGEPVSWTEEEGRELWDTLHQGALADLVEAAWQVNRQGSTRPFSGTVTDTTPSSGPGSTTQPNGESLSPSSADGS